METVAVDLKRCNLCGKGFEHLSKARRCNPCQNLNNRLCRYLIRSAEEERRHWQSLTRYQRQAFYYKWHGELGVPMKRAILEARLESESKHATSTKAYKWQDDFQLREIYKGREEQIENIKTKCQVVLVQGPLCDVVGDSRLHDQRSGKQRLY